MLSNNTSTKKMKELRTYGKNFGLIFQATDDLLDYTGKKRILGKSAQKDLKRNKGNIMKYKSISGVKSYCYDLANSSPDLQTFFPSKNNIFNELIFHIIERVT